MTINLDCAREILAAALEITTDRVPGSARLGDPEAWDSLAHLRLILAIEEKLGRELGAEQIIEIECLEDVAGLLDGHATD